MSENKHTAADLKQMQSLPLEAKIIKTKQRIREWYDHWDGNVYVSFSGGKDSTVLLHLVREEFPNVPAVFVDTGLEFPEIKAFVKSFDNVTILRPKMSFRQVIERYGYPVVSKDAAMSICYARKARERGDEDAYRRYLGLRSKKGDPDKYFNKLSKLSLRLLESSLPISDKCCHVLKEAPLNVYEKQECSKPFIGILAEESSRRVQKWTRVGCNAFDTKRPQSTPIAFWTEQDILRYIKECNIPIASVYGEIVEENGKLRTTGRDRTGCVFCLFGAHLEKSPNRFERLKQTHPQLWEYCMKPWDEGGLGLQEVCDFCGIKTGEE
jgi:3'-phosphoadenosine 5'-phosphosulfate sulfotransferase (PAPS reductase)/FAD synthetase